MAARKRQRKRKLPKVPPEVEIPDESVRPKLKRVSGWVCPKGRDPSTVTAAERRKWCERVTGFRLAGSRDPGPDRAGRKRRR